MTAAISAKSFNLLEQSIQHLKDQIFKQGNLIEELKNYIINLEHKMPINPLVKIYLDGKRLEAIYRLVGGKESPAYQDKTLMGKIFRQASNDFRDYFKIPCYDMLKCKDEAAALEFWKRWLPSNYLLDCIEDLNQGEAYGG